MEEFPDSVLFCCTLNSVRSPIAEGLMKHLYGTVAYVDSAGAREGALDGFVIAVMQEIDIDMSRHHPKSFEELSDNYFNVIIALSPEAQHHAVELTRTLACDVEFWNTFDPTMVEGSREKRLEAYRMVRDQIKARLIKRFGTP
ncbi:MAG: arsenate reductase ArsC [Alphaproteobacteria bacterium]|nr:arsenate reductase ArsC [Alphaproteobacteria bacterium]